MHCFSVNVSITDAKIGKNIEEQIKDVCGLFEMV
jgi:hypothetical protein